MIYKKTILDENLLQFFLQQDPEFKIVYIHYKKTLITVGNWMQNGVASPEYVGKGTGNKFSSDWCKIRCTFSRKSSQNYFLLVVRPEYVFGLEERKEEKIILAMPGWLPLPGWEKTRSFKR